MRYMVVVGGGGWCWGYGGDYGGCRVTCESGVSGGESGVCGGVVHEVDSGHQGGGPEGALGGGCKDDGGEHGALGTAVPPAAQQALQHAHVHPEQCHMGGGSGPS